MNNVVFTRQSDEWETPDTLFESLNTIFNFTLDAASSDDNFKLPKHYTINDDGLSKSWEGERVFCNPPYSQVKKWVKKSYDERNKAEVIVLLIPARTDTKWFHD
ncbi:MAG: adenine methyltransferase, partial [Firmicutes bacterium]|nr:adenine methyltransferase [Bacillota bacterium]